MGVIKEDVIQFQAGLQRGLLRSVPMVAVMAVLLTGCSSVPDAINPAEWYKSTADLFSGDKAAGDPEEEARRKREQQVADAAGQEQSSKEFPKVSDVTKQQASRNLGLAADPDRPRYAPAITRQDQSAAAGEEPKFVRPSGMPSGVGVGETMVISGDGVIEPGMTELPATVMEGASVAGTAQSQPLPPGATRVATIVFPNGSSKLSTRDRQILAQVVALQKERGGTLHVVGHSSSRTRNLSPEKHRLVNYKMSVERAKMVAKELIRRGANRRTVATAALSDTQPLYQEIMPNGEAGNRRAEIFLTR